jgi:L-lactate dehydrogenase complex protein LldG
MAPPMTTRADFMARIRRELAAAPASASATPMERPARPAAMADTIRRELAERWLQTLGRFREEFERVGGVFHRVSRLADVPDLVAGLARERQATRLVTWHPTALGADLGDALSAHGLATTAMPPGPLDGAARDHLRRVIAEADLGLTGVDLAIAETGSLVLLSGAGRPRSTSLLPPCHVAVFDRSVLVESLTQAGVFLEAWNGDGRPAWRGGAINFITGPSCTADIELTLTRGVHGPKEVHAVFVDNRG